MAFSKESITLPLPLESFYTKETILIMAKEKMQMPQSTAGLIRYFEASKDSIKIKPEHVLVISVFIILLEIAVKSIF